MPVYPCPSTDAVRRPCPFLLTQLMRNRKCQLSPNVVPSAIEQNIRNFEWIFRRFFKPSSICLREQSVVHPLQQIVVQFLVRDNGDFATIGKMFVRSLKTNCLIRNEHVFQLTVKALSNAPGVGK